MLKHFIIYIFLILISNANASNKDKIIENLQNTKNFNFDFEQNINGKIEIGNCTIEYPKKIYCNYEKNNKILVSNGKSLVIKTKVSFYRYPINKTPLNLILDKNFLKNKDILEKALKQDSLLVLSPPIRASYNSPFTLPMFKRNEVMYRVDL